PQPALCSTLLPYTTLFRSQGLKTRGGFHGTHRTPRLLRRLAGRLPPPLRSAGLRHDRWRVLPTAGGRGAVPGAVLALGPDLHRRSEEHTSELQSRENLVCR